MSNAAGQSETAFRRARQAVRTDDLLGISDTLLRPAAPMAGEEAPETSTEERLRTPDRTAGSRTGREPVAAIAAPTRQTASNTGLPEITGKTPEERMAAVRSLHESNCPHCTKASEETNIVFGEGSSRDLMFVGRLREPRRPTGRPFVAGREKLDQMTGDGLAREDVRRESEDPSFDNRTPLNTRSRHETVSGRAGPDHRPQSRPAVWPALLLVRVRHHPTWGIWVLSVGDRPIP